MKRIACWVMLLIGGLSCYGQDFSVKLLDAPEKVIQGAPAQVTIEIANVSGREIVIAKGMNGFRWNLDVMNKDRSRRICPQRMEGGTPIPGNIREVLPKNWRMTMVEDVSCNNKAGEIYVQAALVADASEYYILEHDGSHTPFSAWRGQILSKEYAIRIESPTGTDMEAFTQMNGCPLCDKERLLKDFPTSTYAGYVLGLGEGFEMILASRPDYVIRTLWRENYCQNHPLASVKRQVIKDGKTSEIIGSEPMADYLKSQRVLIDTCLSIHPNHARREIMELSRAYQSLALGDKDTALRSLEWVSSKAPTPKWREQAAAVLALLQEGK